MSLNHRYIWSTRFVRGLLCTNRLSEVAIFGYFLTIMTFDWLQFTVIATTPTPNISPWSLAGSWSTFVVTVLGLLYLFKKNGGGNGRHFLRRYFPLSVTVGWKFFVAMLVTLWLVSVTLRNQSPQIIGWCSTAAIAVVNIMMFWRIGFHLDSLAQESVDRPDDLDDVE